jgi:hypothetical protein
MLKPGIILFCIVFLEACTPLGSFDGNTRPPVPDYSRQDNWICLPVKHNASDTVPVNSGEKDMQATAAVDVFYVYPTLDFSGGNWNADIYNQHLNKRIEKTAIRYQATVFNGSCKVYAPLYRQGTLACFYDKKGTGSGGKALQLAYSDVRAAFQYYIKNYNHGRPFIIAGHSQGTLMAYKLLQEFVDTTPLRKQLVAAYLVGYHIQKDYFKNIKPADSATQTGCYITWNSIKWGEQDGNLSKFFSGTCVNPLNWKTDSAFVDTNYDMGSLNHTFHIEKHEVGAACRNGVLTVTPPKHEGYKTFGTGYHIYDYSFFYMNIRKNVQQRTDAYLKQHY